MYRRCADDRGRPSPAQREDSSELQIKQSIRPELALRQLWSICILQAASITKQRKAAEMLKHQARFSVKAFFQSVHMHAVHTGVGWRGVCARLGLSGDPKLRLL